MTARSVGAVALLVVLAGCSGATLPDGSGGTETPTLSPVPVPDGGTAGGGTATPETPDDRLAPGLTDEGVVDAFALAGAHRRALANRSYTVTSRMRLVGPNGTLRSVHRVDRVAAGGQRYHVVERSTSAARYPVQSAAARAEIWFAGGPALFRVGSTNVSYRVGTTVSLGGPIGDPTGHDRLAGLYGGVDRWSVTPRIGWETAFFTLESSTRPDPGVLDVPLLVDDPRDVRVRVVVLHDGQVYHYRIRYAGTFDGRPVEVVRRVRYHDVGNTTVVAPDWLDQARAATGGPTPERNSKSPLGDGE